MDFNKFMAGDYDAALRDPALFWTTENNFVANRGSNIMIAAGMGLDEMIIPHPPSVDKFLERMYILRQREIKSWRGFDVRHTHRQQGQEFRQFDVLAALDRGSRYLTQETFDFLTLRDNPASKLDIYLMGEKYEDIARFDQDEAQLAWAFSRQMVDEAEPHRHHLAAGGYVMEYIHLPKVDATFQWDTLRLLILQSGVFCTIISGDNYVPFMWNPDGLNTSQVWSPARVSFIVEALISCIWRDACVVQEQFTERTKGRGYEASSGKPHHNPSVVTLPRRIYKSTWGQSEEREYIARKFSHAFAVRGCYPVLPEGHQSRDAEERAAEFGYPPPPEGRTFRKPHTRGEGGTPEITPRKVVCRGLQVAKIILG